MVSERTKRCTNNACKANTGTKGVFLAQETECPLCEKSPKKWQLHKDGPGKDIGRKR
jgi:hypothetical protein